MINPVARGFRELGRFDGRDRRREFWPFAAVVVAIVFSLQAVGIGGFGVLMIGQVLSIEAQTAAEQAESAAIAFQPFAGPAFAALFGTAAASVAAGIVLLAAAVTRRLHDRDKSARWSLLPAGLLCCGVTLMPLISSASLLHHPNSDLSFFLMFVNNILYLITLVILIVLLALPGTRGPNRFGPDPVAASSFESRPGAP